MTHQRSIAGLAGQKARHIEGRIKQACRLMLKLPEAERLALMPTLKSLQEAGRAAHEDAKRERELAFCGRVIDAAARFQTPTR